MKDMEYSQKDIVLPDLDLPNPCTVRVKITDKYVFLFVGPRDWQWDKRTGRFVGAGCCIGAAALDNAEGLPNSTQQIKG